MDGRRKSLGLAVAGLTTAGLLFFFAGHASSPTSTVRPANSASVHVSRHPQASPQLPGSAADILQALAAENPQSVAAVLAAKATLGESFDEALARFGPGDPDLISAANEAARFCAASVEPETEDRKMERIRDGWTDASDVPSADFPYSADPIDTLIPDSRRTRARERLLARCAGFDAKTLLARLHASATDASTTSLLAGSAAQKAVAAQAALGASHDRFVLSQAGHILIEQGQLPMEEIFSGEPPVGRAALIPLWWQATALATCASQLGCGPDSLTTLNFCAQHICDPGVSYPEALAAALSPRDYRAVTGFGRWIGNRPR
jgi:hypothetical protein